jgi:hypothetical protein
MMEHADASGFNGRGSEIVVGGVAGKDAAGDAELPGVFGRKAFADGYEDVRSMEVGGGDVEVKTLKKKAPGPAMFEIAGVVFTGIKKNAGAGVGGVANGEGEREKGEVLDDNEARTQGGGGLGEGGHARRPDAALKATKFEVYGTAEASKPALANRQREREAGDGAEGLGAGADRGDGKIVGEPPDHAAGTGIAGRIAGADDQCGGKDGHFVQA